MAACSSLVTPKSERSPKNDSPRTKKISKKKKNRSDSNATQQPPISSPSSVQSPPKKSKAVVIKGSRIYDSENGKCCHQCRQKTLDFVASCTTLTKQCTLNFCHKCLSNRYGEKAEEAVLLGNWICPRCRGICNCSICMKKRGYAPTGILTNTAKATGFSSVSDMLHRMGSTGSSSKEQCEGNEKSDLGENSDIYLKPWPIKINGEESQGGNSKLKKCRSNGNKDNGAKKCKIHLDGELKQENETDCSDKDNNLFDNEVELMNDEIVPDIIPPPPQGTELKCLADIEIPAKDIGYALQFLQFCEAFGKVLNLTKGQSESLLRDLICGRSRRREEDSVIVQFHIRLLSMIQNQPEKKYRSSWLQALNKCLPDSCCLLNELRLDDDDGCGYDDLEISKKLRLLNLLCDEALGTEVLRKCIDEQNSHYKRREKNAKGEALALDKSMRKKLQDEMLQALLSKNGQPLLISEHENLVLKIKTEVAQTLTPSVDAADAAPKKEQQRTDAVRSDPIISNGNGCRFWKLSSFSAEMDILLQDFGEDLVVAAAEEDRWFSYDVSQRTVVEDYMSSFRKLKK